MNREVVGVIAEIVGAVGVMVSLGYLGPQIRIARHKWARGVLELPSGRAWWEQEVQASIFSPEFASIIAQAPISSIKVKLAGIRD